MSSKEWFATWFDTKWYHQLYQDRDMVAAKQEIDALVSALSIQPPGVRVLDLACGKGRHSLHLAQLGFEVTGLDISGESIAYARNYAQDNLEFYEHDMRRAYRSNYYDAIMNMFTSIGYFKQMRENLQVMRCMQQGLKPGGVVLVDFFNSHYVMERLVPHEIKEVNGLVFDIKRELQHGCVVKTIQFEEAGVPYCFQERVQLLTPEHFEGFCKEVGLRMEKKLGGYDLSEFQLETSPRFIFTARKV